LIARWSFGSSNIFISKAEFMAMSLKNLNVGDLGKI